MNLKVVGFYRTFIQFITDRKALLPKINCSSHIRSSKLARGDKMAELVFMTASFQNTTALSCSIYERNLSLSVKRAAKLFNIYM